MDLFEDKLLKSLRLMMTFRRSGIIPWQGGYVVPREEARKIIADLRKYRRSKENACR
jgi:hypothetical protein